MRDVALIGIFVVLAAMTLRHTWVGAMTWTWFSLMNPHKLAFGLAVNLPFAATIAALTLVSILWNRRQVKLPIDALVLLLVAFVAWTCITTALAIFPAESMEDLEKVLKIQLMTLVCLAVLRGRRLIEIFVWVNVLSVGFYGFKGGLFTILTGGGYRVWGPTAGMIQGNNEIGLALVMTIPLMNYLRVVAVQRWLSRAWVLGMVLSAAAVLGTQSRGAFVAIIAMAFVLWLRSSRKLLGAIVMGTLALGLVAFMPGSWSERIESIGNYQNDGSATGRLNAWQTAINVANDRITGAGFAIEQASVFQTYAPDPTRVLTAHSIYFQALGEQGWIGLALFLSLGLLGFVFASRLRREGAIRPETLWVAELAGMVQVSMVGYAVGGAFLSLTYFDLPYSILVILIAAKVWMRERRWGTETVGLFGAGPQVRAVSPAAKPAGALHAGLQR